MHSSPEGSKNPCRPASQRLKRGQNEACNAPLWLPTCSYCCPNIQLAIWPQWWVCLRVAHFALHFASCVGQGQDATQRAVTLELNLQSGLQASQSCAFIGLQPRKHRQHPGRVEQRCETKHGHETRTPVWPAPCSAGLLAPLHTCSPVHATTRLLNSCSLTRTIPSASQ